MKPAGVSEVAEELGISRQRLAQLRQREDFPPPVVDLSSGPIWDLEHIRRWGANSSRQAGRPRSESAKRLLNDRFELLDDPIGSGGFADVFRAMDHLEASRSDEEAVVAVKVLRAFDDEEAKSRFARELRLLIGVDHPHVVPVIDAGEDADGRPWYAMPLAVGSLEDELASLTAGGGDKRHLILDILEQVGEGLGYLHAQGIWHRDLTPGNILRTREGLWALSDFGLAREAERRTATITTTTAAWGTLLYLAPEQMANFKDANALVDVFSLGKVLEAMVLGGHPFPGRQGEHGAFRPVIAKATRSQPHQRYQTVGLLIDDVRALVNASQGRWEASDEALDRLLERVRGGDIAAARETLEAVESAAANRDDELMRELCEVLPFMSKDQIRVLWNDDSERFQHVYGNFTDTIATAGFPFSFCDILADFCRDVVSVTDDVEVVRLTTNGLAGLGYRHNRWHVQRVLLSLLQGVRTPEIAVAALDGLREARHSAVEWTLSDFATRSLHPILRDGITGLLDDGVSAG
jgi:eukaryotic-like serine/threonine-protein kinase